MTQVTAAHRRDTVAMRMGIAAALGCCCTKTCVVTAAHRRDLSDLPRVRGRNVDTRSTRWRGHDKSQQTMRTSATVCDGARRWV